eukprot:GHVS01032144.1.p1 GENE.GHVS01032144.1~~GHVS01032144.1.p1  ORF type:complete len:567 (+),score=73.30 GHVS01032144.1:218-1918(+)
MGEVFGKLFVDPTSLPADGFGFFQVCFLGSVYGCVLFRASCMISEGSELLLLVPSLANVVGSIVLPILGAVPDGAIVLFSGLGPDPQSQLSVGVGALAGSTIMLLTVPWCLSVIGGRVSYFDEHFTYKKPKLSPPGHFSLFNTGVAGNAYVANGGRVMLLSAISYVVIQAPAFFVRGELASTQANFERWFAFVGMLACTFGFVGYLLYQVHQAQTGEDKQSEFYSTEMRKKAIRGKQLSLRGAMKALLELHEAEKGEVEIIKIGSNRLGLPLITQEIPERARHQMRALLRPFFIQLDVDGNEKLDKEELRNLLSMLNEKPSEMEMQQLFDQIDIDASGYVEFEEFVNCLIYFVVSNHDVYQAALGIPSPRAPSTHRLATLEEQQMEEEKEDEEIPEDLAGLPAAEQQRRIKLRAFKFMFIGTLLVLIFADPLVNVFSNIGQRTGIPSFYISFVLAPLASNASEILASYNYSLKKTHKSITISFSALEGAASMNNTFCLGIFLALVFFKNLMWTFAAETFAILVVQLVMALIAQKQVHLVIDGLIVLSLYPLALIGVYCMETFLGWD